MELVIFLVLIFAVFVYVMIRGTVEEKRQKQKYRKYLQETYGSFPDRTYQAQELERIARYYLRRRSKQDIDDITWNDLNMDSIFAHMNFTQSSSGEEYLYAMLRHPVQNDKDTIHSHSLSCMEQHIDYMMKHEEQRLDTLMLLHKLGNTGKYALSDYLDYLDKLGVRSNLPHYGCMILLVISAALIFVRASLGVPLLIGVACINIVTYMKEKGIAAPYVTTFSYIMRMIQCADGILRLSYGKELVDFSQSLQAKRRNFKNFERNSGMVLKMSASTGSMEEVLFDYIKMLTHIDIIRFNNMLQIVQTNQREIMQLADDIGYLDTVLSIGYFRAALPYYCVPIFSEGKESHFIIREGFHPCIDKPVANSFDQCRGMLVTGSNASGKSTFLKMTAINAILAQTIHTCAARVYKGSYFRIYSSMALRDSLENGESYYIVEIKALKRIVDAADVQIDNPLLCFVDEVLRGTNTVERIAASTQILEKLSQRGVFCFAATHDIELTHLLKAVYDNYHFEEEIKDGDVLFSYRLLEGRAHTRNAIKLLEMIGLSAEIIQKADKMAENFLKNGGTLCL